MEVTREEMLELAQYDTFQLDDRLNPLDRRELRSEAWLKGYEFAKDHPYKSPDQKEMEDRLEALQCENKDMREELTKRDDTIRALQQEPEEQVPQPVCGDIVEMKSAVDYTAAPIIALWYKTDRNEQRKLQHYFITIDGNKISRKADEVILEHASPDAIYWEIKQHLQSLASSY